MSFIIYILKEENLQKTKATEICFRQFNFRFDNFQLAIANQLNIYMLIYLGATTTALLSTSLQLVTVNLR